MNFVRQASDPGYVFRLFTTLAWSEFKMRYYGSILGYLWSLLKPLALFAVLYVVFTIYIRLDAPHYKLNLLLGMMIWNFFAEATGNGLMSLISRYTLVRKIAFPRYVLVAASVSSAFLGFLINLIVFFLLAAWEGIYPNFRMSLFLPFLVCLYFTALGISLALSVLIIQMRDMSAIWELVIQIGFWATPVVYPMSLVPEQWRFFLFLNPLAGILEYSRFALIGTGEMTLQGVLYVTIATLGIFLGGLALFFNREPLVVEEL